MKKILLFLFLKMDLFMILSSFTDEHSGFSLVASAKCPRCVKQSQGWQMGHVLSKTAAGDQGGYCRACQIPPQRYLH